MHLQEVLIVTKRKALIAYVVLSLAAVFIAGCGRPPAETEGAVQVGRAAPSFKLPDLSGQEVSLEQYRGRVVMLDFWATWCGPCRMTMPVLESIQKEYANNLVLLAVNIQEPKDEVRNFVRVQSIRSRVLLDEEGSVGATYGADSIPLQVLIDKRGIVRLVQAGFGPSTASHLRSEIQKLVNSAG